MTYTKDNIEIVPIPSHSKIADLTAQVFTRLTILGLAEYRKSRAYWWCECICGTFRKICTGSLTSGNTKSCGCYVKDFPHGRYNLPETQTLQSYSVKLKATWNAIRLRCFNPKTLQYKDYGGRGITMCDRWRYSFDNFITDMGEPPTPKHSIERLDVNGNYTPENCTWADAFTQANNTRFNHKLTFNNKTQTLAQWTREYNLPRGLLGIRINVLHWTPEKAITTAVRGKALTEASLFPVLP